MPIVLKLEYYERALQYLQEQKYRISETCRLYSYPKHWCDRAGNVRDVYSQNNGLYSYNRPEDRKIRHYLEREFFYRRKRLDQYSVLPENPELVRSPEYILHELQGMGYYFGSDMRVIVAPGAQQHTYVEEIPDLHARDMVAYLCNNFGCAYTTNQQYRINR